MSKSIDMYKTLTARELLEVVLGNTSFTELDKILTEEEPSKLGITTENNCDGISDIISYEIIIKVTSNKQVKPIGPPSQIVYG